MGLFVCEHKTYLAHMREALCEWSCFDTHASENQLIYSQGATTIVTFIGFLIETNF